MGLFSSVNVGVLYALPWRRNVLALRRERLNLEAFGLDRCASNNVCDVSGGVAEFTAAHADKSIFSRQPKFRIDFARTQKIPLCIKFVSNGGDGIFIAAQIFPHAMLCAVKGAARSRADVANNRTTTSKSDVSDLRRRLRHSGRNHWRNSINPGAFQTLGLLLSEATQPTALSIGGFLLRILLPGCRFV